MEKKSKIQKVEKLNKATIEFTSERGDFRIIINDQVHENDKWYNDVILRKLELLQSAPAPVEADAPENSEIQEEDLPF